MKAEISNRCPVFPQDEGAHPDFASEWWYVTGHLFGDNDHPYAIFGSVSDYQSGLRSRYNIPVINIAGGTLLEAAITDIKAQQHHKCYHLINYKPALGRRPALHRGLNLGCLDQTFKNGNDVWCLRRVAPDRLKLHGALHIGSIDLDLVQAKPPLFVGGNGHIHMGPKGSSWYYTLPVLHAEGKLRVQGGELQSVKGTCWMDHQWGNMAFLKGYSAWVWFSIQLNNNTQVNIFIFQGKQGRPKSINVDLSLPDGSNLHLPEDLDVATPRGSGWWQSPHSGLWYPLDWQIEIPSQGMSLRVTAAVKDQEMTGTWPFHKALALVPSFYEGATHVTGTVHGQPVTGRGFLEVMGGDLD